MLGTHKACISGKKSGIVQMVYVGSSMEFLADSLSIRKAINRFMRNYDHYSWSVAWASSGHLLFDELINRKNRIKQIVIGTHFYQTDPKFMRPFVDSKLVRFVLNTDGVFHPKIYLFENDDTWACIVGSANFTNGAFQANDEACVLFDSTDKGAEQIFLNLKKRMADYWKKGRPITEQDIRNYEEQYRLQSRKRTSLANDYGGRLAKKSPIEVDLFAWSWERFFEKVSKDAHHSLDGRIHVLKSACGLFQETPHFKDMSNEQRQGIAGLRESENIEWLWFGSMQGAGAFWNRINNNNEHISDALERIPFKGAVQRKHFEDYILELLLAFPKGRINIGTATRLLAMKRPDYFVCLDTKNTKALCEEFGISPWNMSYDRYWDEIVERIQNTVWWNAPRPEDKQQYEVWDGRAAFMDALFYEPNG